MRSIFTCLFVVVASITAFAQNPPCSSVAVERIQVDTGGMLAVTMSNSCMNCSYDGMGCVYAELKVVRTVAPFDTLGASNCWCFSWRDPKVYGKEQTFRIPTSISSIPKAADMRVLMLGCGCDTIPFSKAMLGVEDKSAGNSYRLYPNPATNTLTIENGVTDVAAIEITDMAGRMLIQQSAATGKTVIDIAGLAAGLYIITLRDERNIVLGTDRVVKE